MCHQLPKNSGSGVKANKLWMETFEYFRINTNNLDQILVNYLMTNEQWLKCLEKTTNKPNSSNDSRDILKSVVQSEWNLGGNH